MQQVVVACGHKISSMENDRYQAKMSSKNVKKVFFEFIHIPLQLCRLESRKSFRAGVL
jgi:hypothetical protein